MGSPSVSVEPYGSADLEHHPRAAGVADELASLLVPACHRCCFDYDQFCDDEEGDGGCHGSERAEASVVETEGQEKKGNEEADGQEDPCHFNRVPEEVVLLLGVEGGCDGLCEPEDVKDVEGNDQGGLPLPDGEELGHISKNFYKNKGSRGEPLLLVRAGRPAGAREERRDVVPTGWGP